MSAASIEFVAAAGAMVARQEEVPSVSMPFSVFLVAGFLLVYAAIASPTLVDQAAFVRPTADADLDAGQALGHMTAWEMPVAAALMLASIVE